MSVIEPAYSEDGAVICPARIDRQVERVQREVSAATLALGKARVEIAEIKDIVTNGLQSDMTEVKIILTKVKTIWDFIMASCKVLGVFIGLGISLTALTLGIMQIVERI